MRTLNPGHSDKPQSYTHMDKNGRHKRPDHSKDFSRNAKYFRPTRRGRVRVCINRNVLFVGSADEAQTKHTDAARNCGCVGQG
jgi:hypothetical protein